MTDQRNDTLAAAIADAYATNPLLAARRYDQRALDDEIGVALSQARPTSQVELAGSYDLTLPGDTTQAQRSATDRLNARNVERNDMAGRLIIDQPLWTGGRATSALRAASRASLAGLQSLRSAEGDLLLDVVAAYTQTLQDMLALDIRRDNVKALQELMDEVAARRDAGELTRTDLAQARVQVQAAQVQLQVAEAQLQSSRAAFAALVGRAPGGLAQPPELPGLPASFDIALDLAQANNPELAGAIATERASRARIAQARAERMPQLALRATAAATGPAVPFYARDQDISFAGRATLIVPLSTGGRVRAQVSQAQNRNLADELRIEATKRQVVQSLVLAWNQWTAAEQNIVAQQAQLAAAATFLEGSLAEYRQGLRSTFDVLFAQNSLRDAQIGLLESQRTSYVAQASVLRRIGQLEAGRLLDGQTIEDPSRYAGKVKGRSAIPWGGLIRSIDRLGAPSERRPDTVPLAAGDARMKPAGKTAAPLKVIGGDLVHLPSSPAQKGRILAGKPSRKRER